MASSSRDPGGKGRSWKGGGGDLRLLWMTSVLTWRILAYLGVSRQLVEPLLPRGEPLSAEKMGRVHRSLHRVAGAETGTAAALRPELQVGQASRDFTGSIQGPGSPAEERCGASPAAGHVAEPAANRKRPLAGGKARVCQRPALDGLRATGHQPTHQLVRRQRHHHGHAGQSSWHIQALDLDGPTHSTRHSLDAAGPPREIQMAMKCNASPPLRRLSVTICPLPKREASAARAARKSAALRLVLQAEAQPQRTVAMQATAVAEAPTKTYEVGEKLHGFTCVRVEYVKDRLVVGWLGNICAELLSMVQPADENKTFSVVFRTPPENSNGIAHVLEHSVLLQVCVAAHWVAHFFQHPLRQEPFVELMKSSLQTFLNVPRFEHSPLAVVEKGRGAFPKICSSAEAMTFPDRTCYPVASCNLKDFYNLIDVYMDAVFFPRAINDPLVLAQEGWHYEIEKKDDPLTFKGPAGVVFNEMKGVYSNPDQCHGRTANQSMFPDNQLLGGMALLIKPLCQVLSAVLPSDKVLQGKYYHPSNAKFWFYGDDPADARLELVDQYLSEFDKIEVNSQITVQPKLTEPRRIVEDFAVGEDEDCQATGEDHGIWLGKEDPFEALKFEAPLEELKARLEKGEPVFQDLIKTKILSNSHKVIVESRPSKQLGKQMEDEEKATLQKHRETLTEQDIEDLISETVKLKEIQDQGRLRRRPAMVAPSLGTPEVEKPDSPEAMKTETPKVPTELVSGSDPTVLRHALPTSGVIYTDVAFDMSRVPEDLLPLVPLFTRALKQLGTETWAKGAAPRVGSARTGKAMAPQMSELADLMEGRARCSVFLGLLGAHGGQPWFLSELLKRIENGGWDGVLQELKALQACIFNKASCTILNITSDADHLDAAQASLEKLASNLPADEQSAPVILDPTLGRRVASTLPHDTSASQVNYVGKGGNLYQSGYEYHGSSLVVSKLLGATYLWDKVRVVGGAYGGFCRFDPRSGDFKYLSYRDPNLGQTLDTYDGAPGAAGVQQRCPADPNKAQAVIGCMGDVDAYLLPDAKGYQAMLRHLLGEDDEYRQKVRDEIFGEDFRKFGEALEPVIEKGGIYVVGSAEACDKAKEKYGLSLTSPFAEE
eukprot:Skav203748  [mRNA]  locus=scaffold68:520798:544593:+ [translate_table: standard]